MQRDIHYENTEFKHSCVLCLAITIMVVWEQHSWNLWASQGR